jgi:hypothetical protein
LFGLTVEGARKGSSHIQAELFKKSIGLLVIYNTFLKAQPEDGSIEMSRNM